MWKKIAEALLPIILYDGIGTAVPLGAEGRLGTIETTALTAIIACPVMGWLLRREKKSTGKKASLPAGAYLVSALLGILCNLAFTGIFSLLNLAASFSNETQEALLAGNRAMVLITLVFLTPLAEELVFRGLTYGSLRKSLPVGWAAVIGALLFAGAHGNWIQFFYALPMGVALNLIYERWKDLRAPLFFHMTANLSAVLLSFLI